MDAETYAQARALYRSGKTARAAAIQTGVAVRTLHTWLKRDGELRRPTALERFMAKVDKDSSPNGCWLWTATINTSGYGHFSVGHAKTARAHRWLYKQLVGPLHETVHLDHLCRTRHCVNPDHLEPVTPAVNNRRGMGFSGLKARQTHCLRGHPLSGDNLRITPSGSRQCRTCRKAHNDARYENPGSKGVPATHCAKGHPFDDENTYLRPSGSRLCRACRVENQRQYRARQKEALRV